MDSIEPASDCEHVYHVVEVDGGFLEAGGQSTHVLHSAEEALDDIAHGVEVLVMGGRFSGIRLGGNDRKRSFIGDLASYPVGCVSLVCDDGEWLGSPAGEGIEHLAVMELTAGNLQSERPSVFVYGRVNLTCAAAA